MKQLTVLLMAFSLCMGLSGQSVAEDGQEIADPKELKNELKINVLYALWGYTEVNYERLFKNRTSFGLTIGTTLFDREGDYFNFTMSPHYRIYFGKKNCSGFFFESHLAYVRAVDDGWNTIDKKSVLGLGFAVGAKYVRDSGLSAEVFGGVGRAISDPDNYFYDDPYPRFGIQFGQRF